MPYTLKTAHTAVKDAIRNYTGSVNGLTQANLTFQTYEDINEEVEDGEPKPEQCPCLDVRPVAYDPRWHENRQQKNLFSVELRLWTKTHDPDKSFDFVQLIREALWASKPAGNDLTYIEIGTCFHPVEFANIRWTYRDTLRGKNIQNIKVTGIVVMQFTDDPLDPE